MTHASEPAPVKLLPPDVSSQLRSGIATPSVVQCVEELVVNSIDAGASCIAVRVDLPNYKIQVIDNGKGITQESLSLVGERYATSKCHNVQDLENLSHYGYRGEALASLRDVASVLEIDSRARGSDVTYTKLYRHGKKVDISKNPKSRPSGGTTVTAHNIYYNMPVRRKTLCCPLMYDRLCKRLQAIALIHPNISLTLRDDSTGMKSIQTHNSPSLIHTFGYLFGRELGSCLKEATHIQSVFNISGFIGVSGHWNKSLQFLYVNARLVLKTKLHKLANEILSSSLITKSRAKEGSGTVASREVSSANCKPSPGTSVKEYAVFVLNITCPRSEYDITLDPSKTLVEFKDWDGVLTCLKELIEQFLQRQNLTMTLSPLQKMSEKELTCDSEELSSISTENGQPADAISTNDCLNAVQSTSVRRQKMSTDGPNGSDAIIKPCELSPAVARVEQSESDESQTDGKSPAASHTPSRLHSTNVEYECSGSACSTTVGQGGDALQKYRLSISSHRSGNDTDPEEKSPLCSHQSPCHCFPASMSNIAFDKNHIPLEKPAAVATTKVQNVKDLHDDNKGKVSLEHCTYLESSSSSDSELTSCLSDSSDSNCSVSIHIHRVASQQCSESSNLCFHHPGDANLPKTHRESSSDKQLPHHVLNSLSAFKRSVAKNKLPNLCREAVSQETGGKRFMVPCKGGNVQEHRTIALRWHRSPGFRSRLGRFSKWQDRQEDVTLPQEDNPTCSQLCNNKTADQDKNKVEESRNTELRQEGHLEGDKSSENSPFLKPSTSYVKPHSVLVSADQSSVCSMEKKPGNLRRSPRICSKRNHSERVKCADSCKKQRLGSSTTKKCEANNNLRTLSGTFCTSSSFLCSSLQANRDLQVTVPCSHLVQKHIDERGSSNEDPIVIRRNLDCTVSPILEATEMCPVSDHHSMTNTIYSKSRARTSDGIENHTDACQELGGSKTGGNDGDTKITAAMDINVGEINVEAVEGPQVIDDGQSCDTDGGSHHSHNQRNLEKRISHIYKSKDQAELNEARDSGRPGFQESQPIQDEPKQLTLDHDLQESSDLLTVFSEKTTKSGMDTVASCGNLNQDMCFTQESKEWYSVYDASLGKKLFINRKNGNCSTLGPHEEHQEADEVKHLKQGETAYAVFTRRDTLAHPHLTHSAASFVSSMKSQRTTQIAAPRPSSPDAVASVDAVMRSHLKDDEELMSIKWGSQTSRGPDGTTDCMRTCGLPDSSILTQTVGERGGCIDSKFQAKLLTTLNPCQFTKSMFDNMKVLGQVDTKFIACLVNSDPERNPTGESNLLVFVDQHAAHERIRLEMLTSDAYNIDGEGDRRTIRTSTVTPPIAVRMGPSELRMLKVYQRKLERVGIIYTLAEEENEEIVMVTQLPACVVEREASELKRGRQTVATGMVEALIKEELEVLQRQSGGSYSLPKTITRILNSQACHGAIKFGDTLDLEECCSLIGQLSSCDLPFQCAHGRPALVPVLDLQKLRLRDETQGKLSLPQLWKLKHQLGNSVE